MPIDVQMLADGKGMVFFCRGPVRGEDFIHANEDLLHSPDRVQQLRYAIVDLTAVGSFDVSLDHVRTVAQQDKQIAALLPSCIIAVIAPRDLTYGISRMWEALSSLPGWSTGTFRSRSDAKAWVGDEMKRRFGPTMVEGSSAGL